MAVTSAVGFPSKGIDFTKITDTSADFASVANSTYFYNLADKIVRYKDATGTILEIFSSAGGASGVFGISNASGVYTYYDTLTLAMAAAVSGQVIEMFADFTQSTATAIELKDGVNINGNGHTYTYSATGTSYALNQTNAGTYNININNITILRTIGTGGCFNQFYVSEGNINFEGSVLKSTGGGPCVYSAGAFRFYNITAISTTNATAIDFWASGIQGTLINCRGINTSTGAGFSIGQGGTLNNCYGESNSGSGIFGNGQFRNCVGKSLSGIGIACSGNMYNCSGFSSTGYGIDTTNAAQCISSVGTSASNLGIFVGGTYISKCTGISSSGVGMQSGTGSTQVYDCDASSSSNVGAVFGFIGGNLIGGKHQSDWDNAGGHAISIGAALGSISKVTAVCRNASAYNIYGAVAYSLRIAQNLFIGGQRTWNSLVTNTLITTQDNQGNINL
jgi:hypothetical protein